jgi:hypothetical protein
MLFCLTFCFSNLHTKLERQVLFDFSSEDPDPVRIEICFLAITGTGTRNEKKRTGTGCD